MTHEQFIRVGMWKCCLGSCYPNHIAITGHVLLYIVHLREDSDDGGHFQDLLDECPFISLVYSELLVLSLTIIEIFRLSDYLCFTRTASRCIAPNSYPCTLEGTKGGTQ
jgi:hypothetical protein